MLSPVSSFLRFFVLAIVCCLTAAASSFAADSHSATVDNADFKVIIQDGWLVSWTNKRTGETFDFGKPADAAALPATYQPGAWVIPGYDQEAKEKTWGLSAVSPSPGSLVIQQQLDVKDGFAQAVQWSLQLPLDKIDASYWPTGLTNRMIAKDSVTPDAAIGKSYYFGNRNALISSHSWRERYFVIQGAKGGLLIQVDDPELEHFNGVEMETSKFPKDIILTQRSIASPNWANHYESSKWLITQYDGWVNNAAKIRQDYLVKAFDITPLKDRPTNWAQNLVYTYVRAPFNSPPLTFPGTGSADYTEKWEENFKVIDDWLDSLTKVMDPDKVMFYTNWWRYAGHDTLFPEHSVDPFFAHVVGKVRKRGFHVMLHFHNHLVQDITPPEVAKKEGDEKPAEAADAKPAEKKPSLSPFFGRYVAKQDEWHKAAYPNRPNAVGDPEGKIMWGVGYDFLRRQEIVQRDKEFGTTSTARQGLPIVMTGYQMSPAYEGWRYMKVAEILSAIRSTGADAIHIDVPAVWPEGKERYGINSQQGSREFFKLLRKTLDENGLSNVVIATEASPGEGYMKYVDMAQLVRGSSTVAMLDGINVDTMIELQLGDDLEKAKAMRAAATARYPTAEQKAAKSALRFDEKAAAIGLAKVRELGEPNIDAMVISPFVRAYPHLGSASPLMGGYKDDPAAFVHNQAAVALHTWATLQRDSPFNSSPSLQMFLDKAPWDEQVPSIKADRKESIKAGKRVEGKIFTQFNYGEFALIRWWEKNQPRFAPLAEWQKGDIARYKTADGSTLTVREADPLTVDLALNGKTLAAFSIFGGWKNNETLMQEFAPTFLLDQIDSKK